MGLAQLLREELDKGRREGKQEGKQEGRQEGRLKGESEFFLHLLQKKFITLPDDVEARINNANSEQLLKWSEKLLVADNVNDVFH